MDKLMKKTKWCFEYIVSRFSWCWAHCIAYHNR